MYTMENHWWIWGPKAGKYMSHQPWVVGFNGETWLGFMDRLTILARLWIDSELKAEMGLLALPLEGGTGLSPSEVQ